MIENDSRDDLGADESASSDDAVNNSERIEERVEDASGFDTEKTCTTSIELDQEEVPETDITFECPHCGKGLSIDPRGAGLVISCTLCGQPVTVPIPEGMEIDDFDATPEELSVQLLIARQHLAKAQARIATLEQEVDELQTFRDSALRDAEEHATFLGHIQFQLSEAAQYQSDANSIIRDLAAMLTASD